MSTITLEEVKLALRITGADSDVLVQRLIDSAEQECMRYTNRTELPTLPLDYPSESSSEEEESSNDPVAADVKNGVILMVQADYYADPLNRPKYRAAAEGLWTPYRRLMGV